MSKHTAAEDKSIVISEKQIIDVMDAMCAESLDSETFEAWRKVVAVLEKTRAATKQPLPPPPEGAGHD